MARTRMSVEDAAAAVTEALPADGSPMSHNDLVAALESAGKSDAINHIFALKTAGTVAAKVVGQPDSKPVLQYRRGGSQ